MKLTHQQVDALVYQEKKKFKEKVEKIDATSDQMAHCKKLISIYESIPNELKSEMYSNRNITLTSLLSKYKKTKKITFDSEDFRNKVWIASIEADDLTELKKKLKI